ncbi:MAG: hypothetical protein WBB36_15960, partial [Chitinophagales bacterium]
MRHFSAGIFFILMMICKCSVAQEIYDPSYLEKIISLEQISQEPVISFRESSLTENYNLNYLNAYWEIDPAIYYIKGALTYYFQPVNDPLTAISFDFSDSLLFSGFVYHGDTSFNVTRPGNN